MEQVDEDLAQSNIDQKKDRKSMRLDKEMGAKKEKQERVTLSKDLLSKIDDWITQVEQKFEGAISVSRSDMVNHVVAEYSDRLLQNDFSILKKCHLDEVRIIQMALDKAKRARLAGESVDLSALLSSIELEKKSRTPKLKPKETLTPIKNESQSAENTISQE